MFYSITRLYTVQFSAEKSNEQIRYVAMTQRDI